MRPSVPPWFPLLTILSIGGVFFALTAFPRAFPLVQVDLTMDRGSALAAAAELSERFGWGPVPYRSAASFGDADPSARRFLELEGGVAGPDVPAAMEEWGLSAWLWRVRHVRQGDATELEVRFTPSGRPHGFRLTLPEDAPGPDLPVEEARRLAEEGAREWGFDPDLHQPVEASRTLRPGGRGDHTFVYLRRGSVVGEGDARLRLAVAGDRLSAVEPFFRVPEAFERRFEEMRAANQRIAFAASAFFLLVLVVGGCGVGIFLLIRKEAVAWRPALILGFVIALLLALSQVNGLPLAWMDYDSAIPESLFLLISGVLGPLGILAAGTFFLAWTIAAAEGLGRLAFPRQPALFGSWSSEAAPSPEILGRTVGGYLVAGVELGWVVAFYLLVGRLDGWWTPADALISPDLLATYQPWLQAVALSLMAGVWEEAVFRAVPLAGAALLGQRYGRPVLWIGSALVLQAVVFGAAHADYPQQPAYARVVELFPSALLWGLIYLRYGLLPVILTHALYNLALLSIPLFALSAPGINFHRGVVVAVALLPLAVVAARRVAAGGATALPDGARNAGWRPVRDQEGSGVPSPASPGESFPGAPTPPVGSGERTPGTPGAAPSPFAALPVWIAPIVALVGLVLWASARPPLDPELRLLGERARATEQAREVLRQRGADPDSWTVSTVPLAPWGEAARFLLREGGPEAVQAALAADYLPSPAWRVRFARFDGPVEERAEEWRVEVRDERVRRVVHQLPENRPGLRPTEAEARNVAVAALRREGLDPAALRELSARAVDRPERLDWTLVYRDPSLDLPAEGEAWVTVVLAGGEVVDVVRSVHVPEGWQRAERERRTRWILSLIPLAMVGGGAALLAAVGGMIGVARGRIPGKGVGLVAVALLAVALLHAVNGLPGIDATAATTASLPDQRVQGLVAALLAGVVLAGVLALALGFAARAAGVSGETDVRTRNLGAALGLLLAGLATAADRLLPPPSFRGPEVRGAGDVVPWLAELGTLPQGFVVLLTALLLATALVRRLDARGSGRRTALILVLGGALLIPGGPDTPLLLRGATGALAGVLLLAIGRTARGAGASFLPGLAAGLVLPDALAPMLDRPFLGSEAGGVVGVALLFVLGRGSTLFLAQVARSADPLLPVSPGGAPPGPPPLPEGPPATNASGSGL